MLKRLRFMPFFDADGGTAGGSGAGNEPTAGSANQNPPAQQQGAPAFDYEKLAGIIQGKQNVTEDTVLKNYFKQQGLSQEEAKQAIEAFKAEKAKNQPDLSALQLQAQQAQAAALQAEMEKEAVLMAAEIGVELKTVSYLMKLADTKEVIKDGKIDQEKLKGALNKVLEDVPQLKAQTNGAAGGSGFKFGASGGGDNKVTEEQLKAAFGL